MVLGSEAKQQFEDLTIQLCQQKLEGDKRDKTVAKLTKKKASDWQKVHCYIALCVKRHPDQLPEWEELAAVACAVQNMSLMATATGVAGYWSSWQEAAREAAEMKEFLGLAPQDRCLGVFSAGISDRVDSYRGSRRPLEEKVEWRL